MGLSVGYARVLIRGGIRRMSHDTCAGLNLERRSRFSSRASSFCRPRVLHGREQLIFPRAPNLRVQTVNNSIGPSMALAGASVYRDPQQRGTIVGRCRRESSSKHTPNLGDAGRSPAGPTMFTCHTARSAMRVKVPSAGWVTMLSITRCP